MTAEYYLETKIGDVISIVGDRDCYAGGVSNPEMIGDVSNLNTGKKLELNDIFKVESKEYLKIIIDRVSQKIEEAIKNTKPDEGSGYNFDNPYRGVANISDKTPAKELIGHKLAISPTLRL